MMWGGVSPCICVGQHSGVEPKIMEIRYEQQKTGDVPPK